MSARLFEETLTQRDELLHQVATQLRSRCGDQFRDLRVIVHHNGLMLQSPSLAWLSFAKRSRFPKPTKDGCCRRSIWRFRMS